MKIRTLALGQPFSQLAGRLDPVHAGHADVHDDDVRVAAERQLDGCGAVGGFADDPDVRRPRERKPEALADDLVVVDDQRRDLVRHLRRFYARSGADLKRGQQRELFGLRRGCEPDAAPVADPVRARQLADLGADGRGAGIAEVGAARVERSYSGSELGPVPREAFEEVLARAGLEVERARPDPAGACCRARRARPRQAARGASEIPGRIGAMPTEARIPASTRSESARSRWSGGAVDGSVRRHTSWSSVGTENITETFVRVAARTSTSRSRTISGPRVMIANGVAASASASRHARVSR